MNIAKTKIEKLLEKAGLKINGKNSYDPQVLNEKLYARVLLGGSLALGESYVDGWWEAKSLDRFFYKVLSADLEKEFIFSFIENWRALYGLAFNLQSAKRAFQVGQKHYDIGNDIYQSMLGKTMTYSCGYWKKANNLNKAQEAKLDLICKKINLKKGDYILDIGCGWASFLKFAAENYRAKGLGITVSKEQAEFAREFCKGLPVKIQLLDYRSIAGKFDHIVSVGMFEHVGTKNYRTFMKKAGELLKDEGLFLLHTIGSDKSYFSSDKWVTKYIFSNSMLPSMAQIAKSAEGIFAIEDLHNFGADYDKTLMAWFDNFEKSWPKFQAKYGERFYRMWKYYILISAANFRARKIHLWQIVLSKKGVPGGYKSVR